MGSALEMITKTINNLNSSKNGEKLKMLETLEYECCTKPELLGQGHHIVVVAKKNQNI